MGKGLQGNKKSIGGGLDLLKYYYFFEKFKSIEIDKFQHLINTLTVL
jgi:hypothetical protein